MREGKKDKIYNLESTIAKGQWEKYYSYVEGNEEYSIELSLHKCRIDICLLLTQDQHELKNLSIVPPPLSLV